MSSIFDIPIQTMQGDIATLKPYAGKYIIIVNVASRCGFTSQYKALESLYREYQMRDVVILGFPCNQFGQQESGSNQDIKHFAESCFLVTFPLFAKIDIKGKNQAPLYHYLRQHMIKKPWFFVPWNFTKIVIDPEGNVLRQFYPFWGVECLRRFLIKRVRNKHSPVL